MYLSLLPFRLSFLTSQMAAYLTRYGYTAKFASHWVFVFMERLIIIVWVFGFMVILLQVVALAMRVKDNASSIYHDACFFTAIISLLPIRFQIVYAAAATHFMAL